MRHRLMIAAALTVVLAVAVVFAVPDVPAAAMAYLAEPSYGHLMVASVLAGLRRDHADCMQAAGKLAASIKDGMTPDEIRAIEDDHKKLVDKAADLARQIAEAEAAERSQPPANQPKAWAADEITKIKDRAAAFGLDAGAALSVMSDPKVRTIEEATDALQTRAAEASNRSPRQRPQFQLQADEGDKIRAAVTDGLTLRANPQAIVGQDTATRDRIAAARNWRGMSLLEMGRVFLEETQGVKLRGLSRMELASVLLGMRTLSGDMVVVRAGAMSTSDFSNILANVASKRLRHAYAATPQTWKPFCRQSNNPDFKTKSVVQLSSAPVFKRVREGQEYSYGGMTEGVEQYALATYGRIVPITRVAIINDDLGAFDRLPMMLGRQAASLENSTVYGVLTANAAMNDTVALFHADHGNLMTGSAIDETNLILADKALRDQTTLGDQTEDKEKLIVTGSFLVTGNAYRVPALKILTAVMPTATSGVNVFQGTMTPISDPNISGNKWFVIANPADIDTIEYAYLEGEEGVFIEQRQGFEIDGLEIKARLDFAAKAIDHRGMVYNPGA